MDDLNTIDDLFEAATNFVRLNVNNISKDNLLYFYARYKQSTEGVCNTSRPGLFSFEARSKYDAWKALNDMSKECAMNEYITRLDGLYPDWRSKKNVDKVSSMGNAGTFGFKMSTMSADVDGVVEENQKTLFDWCKEGKLDQLKLNISKIQEGLTDVLNKTDDNGMTLLMWACDRGHYDIVKYLIGFDDININAQDNDGQTCLHYAVSCEHLEIIKELIKKNIDVNLTDSDNSKAIDLTDNQEIIQLLSSK